MTRRKVLVKSAAPVSELRHHFPLIFFFFFSFFLSPFSPPQPRVNTGGSRRTRKLRLSSRRQVPFSAARWYGDRAISRCSIVRRLFSSLPSRPTPAASPSPLSLSSSSSTPVLTAARSPTHRGRLIMSPANRSIPGSTIPSPLLIPLASLHLRSPRRTDESDCVEGDQGVGGGGGPRHICRRQNEPRLADPTLPPSSLSPPPPSYLSVAPTPPVDRG